MITMCSRLVLDVGEPNIDEEPNITGNLCTRAAGAVPLSLANGFLLFDSANFALRCKPTLLPYSWQDSCLCDGLSKTLQ
jgi:hypothetical protein